jgi:hypothetical protein
VHEDRAYTRWFSMNETIFRTIPQFGQSNGSKSKTFLMKEAQLLRAVLAAAIQSPIDP